MSTKPPSWAEIKASAERLVHEYKDATEEIADSQSFWNDFLSCFGVARRRVAAFERRATRASTGRRGRIDVFWPKVLIAEQKSLGEMKGSLAEEQATDYLLGGDIPPAEYPRYIVTSDFQSMQITDLEAPPDEQTFKFPLIELPQNLHRFGFIAGYRSRRFTVQEEATASIEAAQLMANLFEALSGDSDTEETESASEEENHLQQISILLTRLLFLMYGDDAGLWEKGLFDEFLETRTQEDGSDLGAQIVALFTVLNTPEQRRSKHIDELMLRFPYVNGAIFADHINVPFFDRAMRDALVAASRFEWQKISPAIFGSLFQAIKSKQARRETGEHYTTEANILKTLGPLFLDEVRSRVGAAWSSARRLREVHESFSRIKYLDPACGCGNFLIVAYREMRQIELELLVRLRELEGELDFLALDAMLDLRVTLDQFHGIEINWWPAKIAETAMFLVDHQANQRMAIALGLAPDRLPIKITAHINHRNALEVQWEDLVLPTPDTYVFGNPPFVGKAGRSAAQQRELADAWHDKLSKQMDYVTAWHGKTLDYFWRVNGHWAYVTTNTIVQGEPVSDLFSPLFSSGWRIKFAHRTFEWTSEAPDKANVHCVIVGFERHLLTKPRLFEYPSPKAEPHERSVNEINAYLVDGPNVLVRKRTQPLSPALPTIGLGSQPSDGGNLIVEEGDYAEIVADPVARKYLRRYVGGRELVRGTPRWCLWLVDLAPSDVAKSRLLRERIEATRANRLKSTYESTRRAAETPHLFWYINKPSTAYLCLPRVVSDSRRFFTAAYMGADVVSNDKTYVVSDPDGFLFALTASSMFIVWQKTIGGRRKSDVSMSNTVAWNNFPLPELTAATRKKIVDAGQKVLAARDEHPDRSLAEQYNPLAMAPELVKAHRAVDAVVDRAFGASSTCTSEAERQALLFARYQELLVGES